MFFRIWPQKSKWVRHLLVLGFASVLLANLGDHALVSAAGADRFEKRIAMGTNPRVVLTNENGTILVHGVARNEVHVVATKHSGSVEIDMETMGNRLRLDTHCLDPNLKAWERAVDYVLEVPAQTLLEIHNISGQIKVDNVSGNVNIDALNSSIELVAIKGAMILRSVSGNMNISFSSGRIEANSISGDLVFIDLESQSVDGSTTSGNIVYKGNFFDNGRYALSNYSGTIDVSAPANSSFELDARSIKGSVASDIALNPKPHYNLNPAVMKQSLLGIYNDGAAAVHLSSFSGRIRIRKR
jgi:hypothetical protein